MRLRVVARVVLVARRDFVFAVASRGRDLCAQGSWWVWPTCVVVSEKKLIIHVLDFADYYSASCERPLICCVVFLLVSVCSFCDSCDTCFSVNIYFLY